MNKLPIMTLIAVTTLCFQNAIAQTNAGNEAENLKLVALEALIAAPPDRAMPIVRKVLAGDHSTEVKERALFILSQIDTDEAQSTLLELAQQDGNALQAEAIRMVGIGGNEEALAGLTAVYQSGDSAAREAVLEAYLIAGDKAAVFDIAANAKNEEEFSVAVDMLGAMGAREELRQLSGTRGMSASLIDAYAISGDHDTLRAIAVDDSDAELQAKAIEALGIVGGDEVDRTLMDIYRNAGSQRAREAALHGLMISGHDAGLLELYRSATDATEKRELLEYLVLMDSDAIWEVIDSALAGDT